MHTIAQNDSHHWLVPSPDFGSLEGVESSDVVNSVLTLPGQVPRRVAVAASIVAILVGVLTAINPLWFGVAVAGIPTALLLSQHALARTIIALFGGILVLQLSSAVTIEKVGYLGAVVVATACAAVNIWQRRSTVVECGARPILFAAAAVAAVIGISAAVAVSNGTALDSWAIDTPAYWLLVASVILGVDLGVSGVGPRTITFLLLVAAIASAASYAVNWWDVRNLLLVPIAHLFFPSMFLPGAAISLATAKYFAGQMPYRMVLLTFALISAILVTGTRAGVILVLPIFVVLGASPWRRRLKAIPGATIALAAMALLASTVGTVAETGGLELATVQARFASMVPIVLNGDPNADPSLYARTRETAVLYERWSSNIWLGVGPGQAYLNTTPSSHGVVTLSRIAVDSPLVPFERFGLVGVAALLSLFLILLFGRLRRHAGGVESTALLAFVICVLAFAFLSSPLDDKGVALGLIPLIGLCGAVRRVDAAAVPQSSAQLAPSLGERHFSPLALGQLRQGPG